MFLLKAVYFATRAMKILQKQYPMRNWNHKHFFKICIWRSLPRQHSDLTGSLVCDISVRSKRTQLLRVLWDLLDHVSLVLANTGSREAIVIFCDLIVSLTVWATHNEIRVSLAESSHEIPCLLGCVNIQTALFILYFYSPVTLQFSSTKLFNQY